MSSPTSLGSAQTTELLASLEVNGRVPIPRARDVEASAAVHVLYGGAQLFRAESASKLGRIACESMDTFGRDDIAFASCVGLQKSTFASDLARRVRDKLARNPVERMCIDFEDGFGPRPAEEEDFEATRSARELAKCVDIASPVVGIRIKALSPETASRALRTLDLFLTALVGATGGRLHAGFTVTLPKVTRSREVEVLTRALMSLESSLGLTRPIAIELMIETPEALFDAEGRLAVASLVAAAEGRCTAVHLGAYDLLSSLGVSAGHQRLDHPLCDSARAFMQLSAFATGVEVVDGATTLLPIPPHRASGGTVLTEAEHERNRAEVHGAWTLHARNVRHALAQGIHRGWDLHPAQLPARYGATWAFFLEERVRMAERLRAFLANATKATRVGRVFDDAATGQGLLEFFVRGVLCGALDANDVTSAGLTMSELASRSFAQIVSARA